MPWVRKPFHLSAEVERQQLGISAPQILGGHFKTGQRWSPQNRPTGLTQDKNLFYLAGCYLGKVTSENLLNRLHCADSDRILMGSRGAVLSPERTVSSCFSASAVSGQRGQLRHLSPLP